jgi:hypothetical protein
MRRIKTYKLFESAAKIKAFISTEIRFKLKDCSLYQKISVTSYGEIKHRVYGPIIYGPIIRNEESYDISNPFTELELNELNYFGKAVANPNKVIVNIYIKDYRIEIFKLPDDWFYVLFEYGGNYYYLTEKFWKCDQFDGLLELLKKVEENI